MNIEVMRGFGATRRRGTEIGGILLGNRVGGTNPVILVEGFEPVPCEYAFGPSYVLSPADETRFTEAVHRHTGTAVGFFRSHTRDGLALDAADAELGSRHFAGVPIAVLLIKPFASRTGLANFFVSSGGPLQTDSRTAEFEFAADAQPPPAGRTPSTASLRSPVVGSVRESSPRSITVPERPADPPPPEGKPDQVQPHPEGLAAQPVRASIPRPEPVAAGSQVPDVQGPVHPPAREVPRAEANATVPATENPPRNTPADTRIARRSGHPDRLLSGVLGVRDQFPSEPSRGSRPDTALFEDYAEPPSTPWKRWVAAIAFTLAAVLFGAVAGYQYGVNSESPLRNPYDLGMFVRAAEGAVAVHWNQFAFPVRRAARATVTVRESDTTQTVELTQPELRNGEMVYRPRSAQADIRLEVLMPDGRSVSQTISWSR